MTSEGRRGVRRIVAIIAALGMLVPGTSAAASVPTLWFEGSVSAQDWNTDVQNDDEIQLYPWPSTRPGWSAAESAASQGSTGAGGAGSYQVSSIASQDASATWDGSSLTSLAIETSARVDVSATNCAEGDRECVASGHARAEFEAVIEVVETADVQISGTIVSSVGNPSPDDSLCELFFYSISSAEVDYGVECDRTDEAGSVTVAFSETLPAGRYGLDFTSVVTSNAFSFRSAGFAQVVADLRLDVGGPSDTDVAFDWSVEDGFGFDEDSSPGLVDYYEPDGALEIVRSAYPVDFEAQDSDPCDSTRSRTWLIDGVEAAGERAELGPCTLTYSFPAEGVHEVTLEVREAGGTLVGTATSEVVVQDWLIVSIGDSVASGEGNPDLATIGTTAETWQDQQCHRTATAGPARAAALLDQADPKTSVTFVHLACSGATIASGLIGPYTGVESGVALPPQLDDLERFTAGREIDAITVSIGANDVHFSTIVDRCVKQSFCDRFQAGKAAHFFAEKASHLAGWFADLQSGFVDRQLDPSRVFITQYFDPTRDDSGEICPEGSILGDLPFVGPNNDMRITRQEATWASNGMLARLDQEVRAAAGAHDWHFIDAIREPFFAHGYCADDSWVVTITNSFLYQGDKNGALHPNAPGHEHYGVRIAAELTGQLYEGGDLAKPRPPSD
jgi:PKD repeat protein